MSGSDSLLPHSLYDQFFVRQPPDPATLLAMAIYFDVLNTNHINSPLVAYLWNGVVAVAMVVGAGASRQLYVGQEEQRTVSWIQVFSAMAAGSPHGALRIPSPEVPKVYESPNTFAQAFDQGGIMPWKVCELASVFAVKNI